MTIVEEFIQQSNAIEREYSDRALKDGMKAWDYAYARRKEPLGVKHILKIHELLARNIRPDIAGKLRNCNVWIGGKLKVFISNFLLREQLYEYCKDCERILANHKKFTTQELEEKIKKNHVAFNEVHPFQDGNGRTSRILMNLLRIKCGLPIKIIHGWAEGDGDYHVEQKEYYGWFK